MKEQTPFRWRCLCRSTVGDLHVRRGRRNQDNVTYLEDGDPVPHLAVAVSDGHGGQPYARSHIGARFAVQTAVSNLHDFLDSSSGQARSGEARDLLPRVLVNSWRTRVKNHLSKDPVEASDDRTRLYGATLLAALVTSEFAIFVQLGDGDILTVSPCGQVERVFARDEQLIGNETTSLCQKVAWADVMVKTRVFATPPLLIMLSTDGWSNSFSDDRAFLKVGTDLARTLQTEGPDVVRNHLLKWLKEASQLGSGDDITAALIYRADIESLPAMPSTPVEFPAPAKMEEAEESGRATETGASCPSEPGGLAGQVDAGTHLLMLDNDAERQRRELASNNEEGPPGA